MSQSVILVDKADAFTKKFVENFLTVDQNCGNTTVYSMDSKFHPFEQRENINDPKGDYLVSSAHPKMYEGFFEYVASRNLDSIVIPRLHFPEYFVLGLMATSRAMPRISISFFGLNEISSNESRKYILKEFLKLNLDNQIVIHSNWWLDLEKSLPESLKESRNQIIFASDPIYEDPLSYKKTEYETERESLGIRVDTKVILFFGSMFYGKGIDIVIEALQYLPVNYLLLVASNSKTLNFSVENNLFDDSRILHLDRFIEESEVPSLFKLSNLVVLPYRDSYKDGTSGVLVQAALAGKQICVPNFAPFSEIVNRFDVGGIFDSENPVSLAEAIIRTVELEGVHDPTIGWNDYLSRVTTWRDIVKLHLHS
jgi:glycosyltransferase involved in cell wall biosynthesis